ncbi:MAG TPA: hypothetical protein VHD58_06285 [Mycobacteriales bacterium]|nr:hypothetical protein [Mycobacteriales bacterium]
MAEQRDLFAEAAEQDAFTRRVAAFVAPVAADAGAVVDDPIGLEIAKAVYGAFGDRAAGRGLTHTELLGACRGTCSDTEFESRFQVFVKLRMLEPVRDKAHQVRYVFNPSSVAALMVFDRLAEAGGVQEIQTLLDRTFEGLRSGTATSEQVASSLMSARRGLAVCADYLARLVDHASFEELVAERRHHRSAKVLLARARDVVAQATTRFSLLVPDAEELVREAVRYSAAEQAFIDRLLDVAGARRDFSMLDPEQYLTAALTTPKEALSAAFAGTVFDPGEVQLDADQLVTAVDTFRPRKPYRRPPRPPALPPGPDPLVLAKDRAEQARRRRMLTAEQQLQGADEVDLTGLIRSGRWPHGARVAVDALQASHDPDQPYEAELSEALLVDPEGPVSHVSPLTLRRTSTPAQTPGALGENVTNVARVTDEAVDADA